MWPALFKIPIPDWFPDFLRPEGGFFPVRMFGVMVILGFLVGTTLVSRRLAKRRIMTPEESFDFCFYLLGVGILGSRLCYVFQNWGDFVGHGDDIFKIWKGGLVWYGGMALSTVFAFWWLWKKNKPILQVTDAAALGVAAALAIGRFGCFFAGDDYGRIIQDANGMAITDPSQVPWYAVQFPKGGWGYRLEELSSWRYAFSEVPRSHQAPYFVHPVQLYMSFKNLVVLGALLLVASRMKRNGTLTYCYLFFYPAARFVVEYWRGDDDRGLDYLGTGLSFSQIFALVPVLIGVIVLRYVLSQREDASPPLAQATS